MASTAIGNERGRVTHPERGARRRTAPVLPFLIAAVPFLYMTVFSWFRYYPGLGLAIPICGCLLLMFWEKRFHGAALLPMFVCSVFYLLFSEFHLLPSAWTRYWEPGLIFRQWMWIPLLALFSSGYCTFFLQHRRTIIDNAYSLLILTFVVGRISLFLSPLKLADTVSLTVYTLVPENAVFILLLGLCVFFRMTKGLGTILFLLALTPLFTSVQSSGLYGMLIVLRFFGFGRTLVVGVALGTVVAMLVAPDFSQQIGAFDTSSGFRAVLWRDARAAIVQSHFLGVGFGTETFTNNFHIAGWAGWEAAGNTSEKRLLIGSHNTLYEVGLRMGAVGMGAFVFWLVDLAKAIQFDAPRKHGMNCFVMLTLLVNNGFNMGVTSVNFLFCTALCAGWLLAARYTARPVRLRRSTRVALPAASATGHVGS